MEEIELQELLANMEASLAGLYSQPRKTTEERGRQVASEIDALARSSGGSAEFVSVSGDIVNYKLSLPPDVASGFVDEWKRLDAAAMGGN